MVENIKIGEIYKRVGYIFKVCSFNVDSSEITTISQIGYKRYYENDLSIYPLDKFIFPTTQVEKMWFEYCEQLAEYRTKEEALDYMYAKQFVQEYLIED